MFKAYIFDLDGTIIDSLGTIAGCYNSVLKTKGFGEIEEILFKEFIGDGPKILTDRAFKYLVERDKLNYSEEKINALKREFLKDYLNKYNNMEDNKSMVYIGIKESLDYLKSEGKKIAICTNKPVKATENVIKKNFGENYFDLVQGLEREEERKPSPFMVNKLIEELCVKNSEVAYFGDTSTDMLTAKNANVFSVGVLWGFREKEELLKFGASKVISNPLEIKNI